MKPLQKFLLLLSTLLSIENANCDYYTSIVTLHDLLDAELRVISFLEEYMEKMEVISRHVNEKLNELEKPLKQADDADQTFYENPLNAYKIISRFAIDWNNLRRSVSDQNASQFYLYNLTNLVDVEGFALPTNNDIVGASNGMVRLQRTYHQETSDVADGYLMGNNYAAKMTASECYWLGRSLYEVKNYEYAAEWLLQARIRLADELKASNGTRQFAQVTDVDILVKLAPTMYYLGKTKVSLLFNDEILAQDPQQPHALKNIDLYSRKALEERHPTPFEGVSSQSEKLTEVEQLFEEVCSGDLQQTPRKKRKLRCRYVHNNVPFRYIAPFKKEELNHDPPIAYYHEFVTENEINKISDKTEDSVQRSLVGSAQKPVQSDYRTSQNTWLNFSDHAFLKTIAQRLKDLTGLSLDSGEPLQVANYGIGGHYGPHYDFYEDNYEFGGYGNRILTALIYINDVELGGATAFPYLKLAAAPIKRSAIVWDNLHKSLELDYRTKHGGCPVLVGSKWICNEWFHVAGQEFTRPCDVVRDGYKSLRFKDLHPIRNQVFFQILKLYPHKMSKIRWKIHITLFIVTCLLPQCFAQIDYFSSISGLENLLRTEEILLQSFREYVRASKHQLQTLESELHRIEMEYAQAARNTENYLTNPVNVYRLMKRLTNDWTVYEERVQADNAANTFLQQMSEYRISLSFPSNEDFKASAAALARLQETYHLDTAQIASGFLNGVKYGTSMTWQDCFVLGKQLFHMEEYNHTKMWLKESMQRLSREPYYRDPHTFEYIEDAANNLLNLGDFETALKLTNDILSLDPTRETASHVRNSILSPVGERKPLPAKSPPYYHQTQEFEIYKKICRGEITASAAQLRPLRCRYVSNNHPYRLLAPFKVEEHSLDPLVLTFHDFIADTKIATIKYLATPHMQRSTVRDVVTFSKETDFRISKNAWLSYQEHEYMFDMLRDLRDISGLDVTRCEKLQVANYGLGGHYEPHWDFYLTSERIPEGLGNRMATAIFYLTEVEQGGATAFPYLNVAIKPKKGNVLFFYNLHRSLAGDYRTRHGGCPVLKGSKWIANIWINDITQAFKRPCLLHNDDEISKPYAKIT
ncbi:uncharacterized protein [Eurosta solidaginis]|uniref:uncharacterized protein n=1 Tax=Eurosta solidaginis TaxID=178769 RepID=UPI0035310CD2